MFFYYGQNVHVRKNFPQRCEATKKQLRIKKVKTCFNPNDCKKSLMNDFFKNYGQNVHVEKNFLKDVEITWG